MLVLENVEFLTFAFCSAKKEESGKAVAKWLVRKSNCGKASAEAKRMEGQCGNLKCRNLTTAEGSLQKR